MCLQCHQMYNSDTLYDELCNMLETPLFDKWNTTTLGHLFIAATGHNGMHNKEISLCLLEQYLDWYLTFGYECYFPTNGLEPMPSIGYIKRSIVFLDSCEQNKCIHDTLNNMHAYATSKFDIFIGNCMAQKNITLCDKYKLIYSISILHKCWKNVKLNTIKFCKLIYGLVRL